MSTAHLRAVLLLVSLIALGVSLWVSLGGGDHLLLFPNEEPPDSPPAASRQALLEWQKTSTPLDDNDAPLPFGQMKIPTPVFAVSLPRSGTTSTWKYFACGLEKGSAAHHYGNVPDGGNNNNKTKLIKLGRCLQDNLRQNRSLLEGCGSYKVWTDAGYMAPGMCFYPSLHEGALEALYRDHPKATLLNVIRNTESWVTSTQNYNDLWTRWSEKCSDFPPVGSNRSAHARFYEEHNEGVRRFAQDHPSLTYIEVPLEGNDTAAVLQAKTGINASCWMQKNTRKGQKNKKRNKQQQQ